MSPSSERGHKSCSFCHSPIDPNSPVVSEPPPGLSQQDEITYIQSQTRQLDDLITQLQRQKSTLLQRLNTLQSSTRALPPETLSLIFQYASLPAQTNHSHGFGIDATSESDAGYPVGRFFHLIIGGVSVHWRQIVKSTPQLWTSLEMKFYPDTVQDSAIVLRQFLQNSGNLPLTLSLVFSRRLQIGDNVFVDPLVDDLLLESLRRVEKLYLSSPPQRWILRPPPYPQLSSLFLNLGPPGSTPWGEGPDTIILVDNANLRRLHIEGLGTPLQLLHSPVTYLDLRHSNISNSTKVLSQCPNLIECHFTLPSLHRRDEYDGSLPNPLIFHKMAVFDWTAINDPWHYALIQVIQLPSLRTLHWVSRSENWPEPDEITRDFFSRLPMSLLTLELEFVSHQVGRSALTDHLPENIDVKDITLTWCTDSLIEKLLLDLAVTENRRKFPKLRTITIEGAIGRVDERQVTILPSGFSHGFLRMLKGRLDEPNDPFCLNFIAIAVDWVLDDQLELIQMMEQGGNLVITVDREQADWLLGGSMPNSIE